jgi:hypothetical protein
LVAVSAVVLFGTTAEPFGWQEPLALAVVTVAFFGLLSIVVTVWMPRASVTRRAQRALYVTFGRVSLGGSGYAVLSTSVRQQRATLLASARRQSGIVRMVVKHLVASWYRHVADYHGLLSLLTVSPVGLANVTMTQRVMYAGMSTFVAAAVAAGVVMSHVRRGSVGEECAAAAVAAAAVLLVWRLVALRVMSALNSPPVSVQGVQSIQQSYGVLKDPVVSVDGGVSVPSSVETIRKAGRRGVSTRHHRLNDGSDDDGWDEQVASVLPTSTPVKPESELSTTLGSGGSSTSASGGVDTSGSGATANGEASPPQRSAVRVSKARRSLAARLAAVASPSDGDATVGDSNSGDHQPVSLADSIAVGGGPADVVLDVSTAVATPPRSTTPPLVTDALAGDVVLTPASGQCEAPSDSDGSDDDDAGEPVPVSPRPVSPRRTQARRRLPKALAARLTPAKVLRVATSPREVELVPLGSSLDAEVSPDEQVAVEISGPTAAVAAPHSADRDDVDATWLESGKDMSLQFSDAVAQSLSNAPLVAFGGTLCVSTALCMCMCGASCKRVWLRVC